MEDATPAEVALVVDAAQGHLRANQVDHLIGLLLGMRGPTLGFQVDRYEHSLQTASRALRDGARTDMIVAALLHDVADNLAPTNHSEVAAAILGPYLDEEATWVVRHHGVFQGYHYWHKMGEDRDARDRYRASPHFEAAAHFCAEWDQTSFDPDYDTLGLEVFEPMVRFVFSRPAAAFGAGQGS
ncbi:MAG TPA: HD domain-containing protein [Acidimicrobiales bacterium]|jgi:predicted HD phosphohydrolase|nr:HD domain-containing protein [Acidimicrobiales bacterium]